MADLTIMRPVSSGPLFTLKARISAACIHTPDGWKIAAVHMSAPSVLQGVSGSVSQDTGEDLLNHSVFLNIDQNKQAILQNHRLAAQLEARNQILNIALEHTSICEYIRDPDCVIPRRTCEYYHCSERYEQMPDAPGFLCRPSCTACRKCMRPSITDWELPMQSSDTLRLLVPGIYVNRNLDGRRAARLCCGYH
ncbi:MAG: hypothetical protein ACLUOI_23385 [Eisenbergiella sp.]